MQPEDEIIQSLREIADSLHECADTKYYAIFLVSQDQVVKYHHIIVDLFKDYLFPYGDEECLEDGFDYRLKDTRNPTVIFIEFPGWEADPHNLDILKQDYMKIIDDFIDTNLEPVRYVP